MRFRPEFGDYLQDTRVDLTEMTEHLEAIARSESVPPSARVRAIEVLLRITKQRAPEDAEWDRIVAEFGGRSAE